MVQELQSTRSRAKRAGAFARFRRQLVPNLYGSSSTSMLFFASGPRGRRTTADDVSGCKAEFEGPPLLLSPLSVSPSLPLQLTGARRQATVNPPPFATTFYSRGTTKEKKRKKWGEETII